MDAALAAWKANPATYSSARLVSLFEAAGKDLFEHLDDEVNKLLDPASLRKHLSAQDVKHINEIARKEAGSIGNPTLDLPFLAVHTPSGGEKPDARDVLFSELKSCPIRAQELPRSTAPRSIRPAARLVLAAVADLEVCAPWSLLAWCQSAKVLLCFLLCSLSKPVCESINLTMCSSVMIEMETRDRLSLVAYPRQAVKAVRHKRKGKSVDMSKMMRFDSPAIIGRVSGGYREAGNQFQDNFQRRGIRLLAQLFNGRKKKWVGWMKRGDVFFARTKLS